MFSTVNVQHLESLNDQVWHVTGIRVRETIPDWVVGEADEVVMVDVTPRALLHRLERGVVYAPEKAQKALEKADFKSVRGDFKFGPNHYPTQNFYMQEVVKEGDTYTQKTTATAEKDVPNPHASKCSMK